jgi:hypothetical protein
MRRLRPTVLALGGWWWLAGAQAQEAGQEPGPDLDFLEYLGAWAEEDDEWLAIEEWQKGEEPEDGEGSEREKDEDDEGE